MKELKIFIVSSTEYLRVAHTLKGRLEDLYKRAFNDVGIKDTTLVTEVWDEGRFNQPKTIHQTLDELLPDFGVILFSGDDRNLEREEINLAPRDNVLIECGILLGKLGADKVHLLAEENVKIPSDLKGVSYINIGVDLKKTDITGDLTKPANELITRIMTNIKSSTLRNEEKPSSTLPDTPSSEEKSSSTLPDTPSNQEKPSSTLPDTPSNQEKPSSTLPDTSSNQEESENIIKMLLWICGRTVDKDVIDELLFREFISPAIYIRVQTEYP